MLHDVALCRPTVCPGLRMVSALAPGYGVRSGCPPPSTEWKPDVIVATATGVCRSVVVSSPSAPDVLRPQHIIELLLSKVQLCQYPPVISVAVAIPAAATEVSRSVVVPSPSCPYVLSPQHRTVPLVKTAQVWFPPAPILATPEVCPETFTGVLR